MTQTLNVEQNETDLTVAATYTDSYRKAKAVLVGDTYGVFKEAGVDDDLTFHDEENDEVNCHHQWTELPPHIADEVGEEKAWVIDAKDEAMDALEEACEAKGFTFDRTPGDIVDPQIGEISTHLTEYEAEWDDEAGEPVTVEEGTEITVVYEKAKGNWDESSYSGYVVEATEEVIKFRRHDDDTLMQISTDEKGKVALFTTSRYPFMGPVVEVEIEG